MNAARRRVLAGALAAALPGCSFAPVDVAARTFVIDAFPTDLTAPSALDAVLLVLATDADEAYDTARMAYSSGPHDLAYFARNEWAEPPARMLNALLVRTLEATRRFRAIVTPPWAGRAEYALATGLVDLRQDFTTQPPALRLVLRAQLRDGKGRAIAGREFSEREPLSERSPQAGVEAANAASSRALREIARFVVGAAR